MRAAYIFAQCARPRAAPQPSRRRYSAADAAPRHHARQPYKSHEHRNVKPLTTIYRRYYAAMPLGHYYRHFSFSPQQREYARHAVVLRLQNTVKYLFRLTASLARDYH